MSKTTKARAPGMTQISISVPATLVAKIDEMAAAQSRNRSNFIVVALEAEAKRQALNSVQAR
jgi:metal-responsive CopG/Arc/MetJ family transcriptional regulator